MPSPLAVAVFWVAAAACAVAQGAILRSVFRGRSARSPIELLWAVGPGVVLALVFVWTWHAMHPDRRALGPSAPVVLVPTAA